MAPACSAIKAGPDPNWVSAEVPVRSETILWEVTRHALQRQSFPVVGDLDPRTRTATSGWKQDLAPFRGKGFREQALVRFGPIEGGFTKVEVRVRRETNEDIVNPLDATHADWEETEDNVLGAGILLQHIKSYLSDPREVTR